MVEQVRVVWQTVALVGLLWLVGAIVLGMAFGAIAPPEDDSCPECYADWKQPHEKGCSRAKERRLSW